MVIPSTYPIVVLCHCKLISWFSGFVLYLDTQLVYKRTSFTIWTFQPKVLTGAFTY